MTPDYVKTMSDYNQWMNKRLYELCSKISDEERRKDRKAFFTSIHGTLNHILLADKVWMGRFEFSLFKVTGLDQILFDDYDELKKERQATDTKIDTWVNNLTADELNSDFKFNSISDPGPKSCKLNVAVTHFFNHQTHHRGQITTLLNQVNVDFGVTDLLGMPGLVSMLE